MSVKSVRTTKQAPSRGARANFSAKRTSGSAGSKQAPKRKQADAGKRGATRKPTADAGKGGSGRERAVGTEPKAARRSAAGKPHKKRPYTVRNSPIHGRGVFAARVIRKGEDIIEYRGRRISTEEADELPDSDPDNPFHTFLFELNDGRVIDAARGGNASRWINHSCAPNCEPYEDDDCRVFIAAKRTIRAGEELGYDYKLHVPGRRSARMLANYACRCGAPRCRGTMVDPKKK